MKDNKELNREVARNILAKNDIHWKSLNNDTHWKIGHINFYPTTGLWQSDNIGGDKGRGIDSLLRFLTHKTLITNNNAPRQLSAEQMFNIAKRVKPMNLEKVCEELHKAIYIKGDK